MKLDSRYVDYSTVYSIYFGRALILLKYIYGTTNYGKLFDDKLSKWFIEAGSIQYQSQMSICYKYAKDETKILFLMLMIVSIVIHLNLL